MEEIKQHCEKVIQILRSDYSTQLQYSGIIKKNIRRYAADHMASMWSNRKGIPLMKTVSLLCKLIQF